MKVYGDGLYAQVFGKSEQLEYEPKGQRVQQPAQLPPLKPNIKPKSEKETQEDIARYKRKLDKKQRDARLDRVAEELRTDPNSRYHGTPTSANIPKTKRCHCPKCEQALKEYRAKNRKWQARSRNHTKHYPFYINEITDADMIEHLKKQEKVSIYIKELIRKDMAKG